MDPSSESSSRDRRRGGDDRRRRYRDRRMYGRRLSPSGAVGRLVGWATGPWSSANGLSWFRLVLLIVVLQWGVVEFYMIPSSSMEPTLHGDPRFFSGDRVAVNKLAFGPRLPFVRTRLIRLGEPKRWDVVVFDTVSSVSEERVLVKRVVGLPGERVEIRPKGIFINGKLLEIPEELRGVLEYGSGHVDGDYQIRDLILSFARRGKIPIKLTKSKDPRIEGLSDDLHALQLKLPEGDGSELSGREKFDLVRELGPESVAVVQEWWSSKVGAWGRPRYGVVRSPRYTVVPKGHYFCLGDNSPESHDSRFYGWVPHENLVGRAYAVAFPPSRVRDLTGFSGTVLGLLGLIGIPLAVVLWEVVPGFVAFSWRVRGTIPALGLERGDHVLVDRLALGPRVPFSSKRFWWRRDPRPGEVVCYSMSRVGRGRMDLYFGDVRETPGSGYVVRGPGEDEGRWLDLGHDSIVGVVRGVLWPRERRGAMRVTETDRTANGSENEVEHGDERESIDG